MSNENHKIDREDQMDLVFMNIAKEFASLSHCTRAKVGAIIIDKNRNIISCGFNGTPTGFSNKGEHEVSGVLVTIPEVLHAESNAILKLAKSTLSSDDSTLYITLSPCFDCAKLIIQAGIKRIVYSETYRNTESFKLFEKAGIEIKQLNN